MIEYIFKNKEWIFSGIGIVCLGVIWSAFRYWRHRHQTDRHVGRSNVMTESSADNKIQAPSGSIIQVYAPSVDAPSIDDTPIKNTHPMDYFKQSRRIRIGDYREFASTTRVVRIEVVDIKKASVPQRYRISTEEEMVAHLDVSVGGAIVFCGQEVTRTGVNSFLVPKRGSDAEPRSLFMFSDSKDHFSFLRIFVDHINPHDRSCDLSVLSVRGSFHSRKI